MRLPASPLVAAKPDHRQPSRSAISIHGSPPYPAAMPGAPYYAEAFSRLPGRCFRLVAHHGEAGPTPCPEPVAWRGSMQAPKRPLLPGRDLRRPPAATGRDQQSNHLASRRVVSAGAQVQVDPAALPLDLVDLALAVVLAAGLEGEQLCVLRSPMSRYMAVSVLDGY
jgi:hypothetical protein